MSAVMADKMTDPAQKAAVLRIADLWMRLAQQDRMVGHILDALEDAKAE